MTGSALPDRARVVVIGGGVIGASIAYHLAHAGVTDVVVLERDRLTSGTTWHAAGLMTTFGSTSETLTGMRLYSRDLYARLETETGLSTGVRPVGLIEAADETRMEEYRRAAVFQRHLGLEVEEITPGEMVERFPWATTDGLVGGFWVPGDGRVNPVDVTMSLARGARNLGARVIEGATVERVLTRRRGAVEQVTGVRAAYGGERVEIECEQVVNCAGMWARELAGRNGVVVPNQAAEHYYLITDTIDGIDPDGPIFEDPSSCGYYREEGGGMMVGIFEPDAAPWAVDVVPQDFSFGTIPADWDRMTPVLERAMARVPVTLDVGVRTLFCGPESFTPDLLPAVGEAPGVEGYFVCAGLNSVGILSAGGMGRVMAHWLATGAPDVDMSAIGVERFRSWQLDPRYREERTREVLGTVYTAHPPGRELRSGRGVLDNPLRDRLVDAGAWLRDVSGFESAGWYAGQGRVAAAEPGWGPQPWHGHWAAEHRRVRESVGVIDMSFMTQLRVTGPDAERVLSWLSAGDVSQVGQVAYTPWLRDDGGIEADLTVTRLAEEDFLVVASDTARGHVEALLHRAIGEAHVTVDDLTERWVQLNVVGPRSREVLAGLVTGDVSDGGFPFRCVRWVDVAGAQALLQRVTYVGELGFELHLPGEHAPQVWDAAMAAGAAYGIGPVGLAALGSLRLERGYRDWGHDIDSTDDVHGAGLGFTVQWGKEFRGCAAALAGRGAAPTGRLLQVLLREPEPMLHHAEVVLRDGVEVGLVRAASYGWTLGGAVGLAFVEHEGGVTPEWLGAGSWEVDVAGVRVPARVSLKPLYAGSR